MEVRGFITLVQAQRRLIIRETLYIFRQPFIVLPEPRVRRVARAGFGETALAVPANVHEAAGLIQNAITKLYPTATDSIGGALGERRVRTSRIGGWPKKRLYSRLNWLALSYPTSKAALAASSPSVSIRPRAACSRSFF